MRQPGSPPIQVEADSIDLLSALLDSWTLWEAVAADEGSPGLGTPWRPAALCHVTGSGDYRPYGALVAAATEVGMPPDLADLLLSRWGSCARGQTSWPC